jgi:large subunit ribosomal protein L30
MGMLQIVKDYVTFGPVNESTIEDMLLKRGKKGAQFLRTLLKEEDIKKAAKEISSGKKTIDYANPVFMLRPPSKGYKNVKAPYPLGELGKRTEIDSLIKRMI